MKISTTALSLAAAGGLAFAALAGPAGASDDERRGAAAVPAADWMSVSALATKLEGQGYRIREIEIDDGYYEVEMVDANGLRVEAYLDPVSGEPVRGERYGERDDER